MLHRNNPVQPWSPPMNAKPYPGAHAVGGATPNPWDALVDEAAASSRRLTRELTAAHPAHAALAAMAWQANQAITRQVSLSWTLADLARRQGQAVVTAGKRAFPEGPLRDAMVGAGTLQVRFAETLAEWALGFGRRFGHLAFAFPGTGRS
jgi:hypothetical protein